MIINVKSAKFAVGEPIYTVLRGRVLYGTVTALKSRLIRDESGEGYDSQHSYNIDTQYYQETEVCQENLYRSRKSLLKAINKDLIDQEKRYTVDL